MKSPPSVKMVLYHDVLCGWSWLADRRLRLLREEFGPTLHITYKPFAIRLEDRLPTEWERMTEASAWRKVGKEPDGKGIVTDLWRSEDPPRSSLPPLIALEAAATIHGNAGKDRLLVALRKAALFHGINITRDDVILEIAAKTGLDPHRFANAYSSEQISRIVYDEHDRALSNGIESTPSLVIEGDWLIAGTRTIEEYRKTIKRYVQQQGLLIPERIVH